MAADWNNDSHIVTETPLMWDGYGDHMETIPDVNEDPEPEDPPKIIKDYYGSIDPNYKNDKVDEMRENFSFINTGIYKIAFTNNSQYRNLHNINTISSNLIEARFPGVYPRNLENNPIASTKVLIGDRLMLREYRFRNMEWSILAKKNERTWENAFKEESNAIKNTRSTRVSFVHDSMYRLSPQIVSRDITKTNLIGNYLTNAYVQDVIDKNPLERNLEMWGFGYGEYDLSNTIDKTDDVLKYAKRWEDNIYHYNLVASNWNIKSSLILGYQNYRSESTGFKANGYNMLSIKDDGKKRILLVGDKNLNTIHRIHKYESGINGTRTVFSHYEQVQTGTKQVQTGTHQVQVGTNRVQTGTEQYVSGYTTRNRDVATGHVTTTTDKIKADANNYGWQLKNTWGVAKVQISSRTQFISNSIYASTAYIPTSGSGVNNGWGVGSTQTYRGYNVTTESIPQYAWRPTYRDDPIYETRPTYRTDPVYTPTPRYREEPIPAYKYEWSRVKSGNNEISPIATPLSLDKYRTPDF